MLSKEFYLCVGHQATTAGLQSLGSKCSPVPLELLWLQEGEVLVHGGFCGLLLTPISSAVFSNMLLISVCLYSVSC